MDRLIAPNTVPVGQGDTAPATGTPGQATSGNPAVPIPATILPAYGWNMLTEEMRGVIVAAGIAPSGANWTQLLAALQAMFGITGNVTISGGWVRLPGGYILQAATGLTVTGNCDPVIFPTAFMGNATAVVPTEAAAAGWNVYGTPTPLVTTYGASSVTRFGFNLSAVREQTNGTGQYSPSSTYNYIAFGK